MDLSKWDENYPVCIKDGSPAKDEHSNLCAHHAQFIIHTGDKYPPDITAAISDYGIGAFCICLCIIVAIVALAVL